MTDWPDRDARWHYPDNTPENREVWQRAVDEALQTGSLTLTNGTERNTLWLEGACPRCEHRLRQRIRYNVIRGKSAAPIRTNIDCTCENAHDGRDASSEGCGWGGPLAVELPRPGGR